MGNRELFIIKIAIFASQKPHPMKKIFLLAFVVLLSTTLFGQTGGKNEETIFTSAEIMPEYPGGMDALISFISNEIVYPQDAREHGITGTVLIKFVVEKDGSVSNAETMVPLYPSIDKESVRTVMAMPKWKPGMQEGKPVRCYYSIPLTFRMSKKEIKEAKKRMRNEAKKQ